MIKAILFDLDGTLIVRTPTARLAAVDGAIQMLDTLVQQGDYAIILVTDPLCEAHVLRARLEVELPIAPTGFAFSTTRENVHFEKPNPALYAEVLARVGIEPDEAIMVGDSIEQDIAPAAQVGLHTFHITHERGENKGGLQDFYRWMQSDNWRNQLPARRLAAEMIAPELIGNVAALFGMLAEVQPHHWNQHPDPDEWSILQIVCHLLESEHTVQRPRLQRILSENNPFLSQPKPPPGPRDMQCSGDGYHLAAQFKSEREKTIDWLGGLSEMDWLRPARHSIFGPTTLLEMAHFTAQHDRLHLNQLCRTLGNCS